ncbi:hypothetical protein PIB30_000744 [Stylosanthes scabra]|uniref:Uncharacterized protein n=1 Tax=Stylosanthes scabra TaxID=79078 RepID=A0ABU6Z0I8_9FABA|nr:hypothetical protein [Stylosanthes scabra]
MHKTNYKEVNSIELILQDIKDSRIQASIGKAFFSRHGSSIEEFGIDYTNPYLPIAQSAMEESGQVVVDLDGKRIETESNVLLASIEDMQYAVTLDVLHMVFSAFVPVKKIAMFDKNGGLQDLSLCHSPCRSLCRFKCITMLTCHHLELCLHK